MSTVQEIEAAIEQLPPKDFHALQDWMAKRAVAAPGRPWTPETLSEAARQAVNEPDSAKAQALWERTVAAFTATQMPEIRRRAVLDHLRLRMMEREISPDQLGEFARRLDTEPKKLRNRNAQRAGRK